MTIIYERFRGELKFTLPGISVDIEAGIVGNVKQVEIPVLIQINKGGRITSPIA